MRRQKINATEKKKSQRRQRQRGRFLNRCDFTYVRRDTVNQVGKIVPGLIKNAGPEINNIAQQ